MNKQLYVKTAVCSEYQRLLEESQRVLKIWNEQRAKNCQSRLIKKEEGDELLRLEAQFARAYAVLQRHSHGCLICQLVSRIEGSNSENNSDAISDSELYV
jgi:hypothetical protein